MRRLPRSSIPLVLASALALAPAVALARPLVVDAIAAVVDGAPILLSEVRSRARRYRPEIDKLPEADRGAARTRVERGVCDQIVDERLVANEAKRREITVSEAEITEALKVAASANNMTSEALTEESKKQGWDVRSEIGRQVLEGKVLRASMREDPPDPPVTDVAAIQRLRDALVKTLRTRAYIEVHR